MSSKPRQAARSGRFFFVLVALALMFFLVGGRLAYLQVVAASEFADRAVSQRTRDITLAPRRGSIYDREGEPLAVSMQAKTIYATPHNVSDAAGTAQAIAGVLGGDPTGFETKLLKDSGFVYIARKVPVERAAALEQLDLAGIAFLDDSRRTYPSGELASQILGFVGVDDTGLAGLEKYYDEILAGTPGLILAERDPFGRPIAGGVMKSEEPVDGQNIVLTIDKDIQYQAQYELAAAVKEWKAKSGSVIVMDPDSGEIYAMASVPGFDPNNYGAASAESLRNRPITDTYEPGSTVKSLTAAAVLDKGLFTPTSPFVLPPTLRFGNRTIGEAHGRGTVTWTLTEIVTKSSNVGAVRLGEALGAEGLYEYFKRFGLTEKTGVDFPGEVKGWMPPTGQWSLSTIGTIPFGQGISMTPLQLARALSSIANGGELPTPHFLLATPDDPSADLAWPRKRAISEEAAAATRLILEEVVSEGTGEAAAVPGYEVAGKTGTAQKARTDGRGYAAGKYVGSFSGFLPADDPRVLIIVSLDEPSNAIYGGVVAAPTFSRLAQFSVQHLKIPPTTSASSEVDTSTAGKQP